MLHYSVWYKYYNKNWRTKVAKTAFSKTWCDSCQKHIESSTKWYKYKNSTFGKSKETIQYNEAKEQWKQSKSSWRQHIAHAEMERKAHETLRNEAKNSKGRLICFDFKTNLVLPYWGYHCSPRQVYYMSRMNVFFFGLVDEGKDQFTGFTYPENFVDSTNENATKKGSTHVIAMLYNYLQQSGLTDAARKEDRTLHLSADNCSGQNKNQFITKFLIMAVELNWADDIFLSFMVPGHTKFGPDRWFALIGKHIIKHDSWNMDQLLQNISASMKHQQLVRDLTKETCYNFRPWLNNHYKKPPFPISEQYHFWFSSKHPGAVRIKEKTIDEWSEAYTLRKTKGILELNLDELDLFQIVPLSLQKIKTMRECRTLIDSTANLDFESEWEQWERHEKVYEVHKVLACRKRHGIMEYKVKFRPDKHVDYSQDKYDEWLTIENLSGASDLISKFKGPVTECLQIHAIHDHNPETDVLLVQWHKLQAKADWTWETTKTVTNIDPLLYSTFKAKK